MSKAKKALWDSDCSSLLTAAGLSYQQRRESEKRSQAAADLDDILVAFNKLDEIDKLPEIFCEAIDLVLLVLEPLKSLGVNNNDNKVKSQVATTIFFFKIFSFYFHSCRLIHKNREILHSVKLSHYMVSNLSNSS